MKAITIVYPGELRFEFELDCNDHNYVTLEKVFHLFNAPDDSSHPQYRASRMRSLSVNDFVCIDGLWWQCAGNGWNACAGAFVEDVGREVMGRINHARGYYAWHALQDVMREEKL